MKYFYLILWSGHMHEVPYTEAGYKGAFELWNSGGQIIIKSRNTGLPMGIAASDIKQIYDQVEYKGWCDSTRPKEFIRDGIWYDGKERGVLRTEPWRQKEINEVKKIATKEKEEITIDPAVAKKRLAKIRKQLTQSGVLPKK